MKNILFISPTGGYAGVDACLDALVCGIDKTKYKAFVVFPFESILKDKFESLNITCFELPLKWWTPTNFSGNDLRYAIENSTNEVGPLINIIKDNNIDIVVTNTTVCFSGAIAAAICDVAHIFYMHAAYVDNIYTQMSNETKFFLYKLMGYLSNKVICCSKLLKDFMDQYIDNGIYIYNGVDCNKFAYKQRKLLDNLRLVCIGHYNGNKQQNFIIEGIKIVKDKRPDLFKRISFTMIGPGEEEFKKKLIKLTNNYQLKNVTFMGFCKDVQDILNEYNLYLNSSITETFPVSVLEAMSSGMPIIGTPNNGNLQLIHEGINGYIVSSSELLADRLIYLLENPEVFEKMSKESREIVEKNYSLENYINEFSHAFEEIEKGVGKEYSEIINAFYKSLTEQSLISFKTKKKLKLLVIYPEQANATYYIAAKIPLDYLTNLGLIEYSSKLPNELENNNFLDTVDVVFCLRCFDDFVYNFLQKAKYQNKLIVWYIDDNYNALKIEDGTIKHITYQNNSYERMYSFSDVVLVNNGNLFALGQKIGSNIYRLPTYQVDNRELIDKYIQNTHNDLVIGFMGTLMRDGDFEFVVPAIKRVIDNYANIKFEFIGYCPETLKTYHNVKHFDFLYDYNEFRDFFASRKWDIALAPLSDTEFNRSKTNNKFREYSSFMIPGIYSNISTYNTCVSNGITGILCNNTSQEWYQSITRLIEDDSLRKNIAHNAYNTITANYSKDKYALELLNILHNNILNIAQETNTEYHQYKNMARRRIYKPEEICLTRPIKRRKYRIFCELPAVNEIGILLGSYNIPSGNVTLNIYLGRRLLRTSKKAIQNMDFSYWVYFPVDCIYCALGKLLTIEIVVNAIDGDLGVFEDMKKRTFIYRVCNKIGLAIKGIDVLMVDVR